MGGNIFGFEQVHFSAASVIVSIAGILIGSGLIGYLIRRHERKKGRAFDQFSISRIVLESQGAETLVKIRGMREVMRLEDMVRGLDLRKEMVALARKCTPEQRFVLFGTPAQQYFMLETVRDAVLCLNQPGELAGLLGLPVKKEIVYFCVTGTGVRGADIQRIRVLLVTEEDMVRLRDSNTKWRFEEGKNHFMHRIEALITMANAHFKNSGHIKVKGYDIPIVGWIELKTPNYMAVSPARS